MPASSDRSVGWWDDFRLAAAFFTRLPFGPPHASRPLGEAARAFPLVGGVVGLAGSLALEAALWIGLSDLSAALLALGVIMLLTGALHEDGLADVADGFGGGRTRPAKLEIMRDSRIGTYGVLALILSVGLRGTALAELAKGGFALVGMVAAGAISRGLLPVLMSCLPLARPDGLAATAGACSRGAALAALALGGAVAFGLLALVGRPGGGLLGCVAAAAATAGIAVLARRQIGGYTGDVLGAAQQAAETAFLLALAAAA